MSIKDTILNATAVAREVVKPLMFECDYADVLDAAQVDGQIVFPEHTMYRAVNVLLDGGYSTDVQGQSLPTVEEKALIMRIDLAITPRRGDLLRVNLSGKVWAVADVSSDPAEATWELRLVPSHNKWPFPE